jgi:neutral ceramidase
VIELANNNPAYVPTLKAFANGDYETVNSRLEPGSGEKMVEAAVKLLKQF